MKTWKEMNELWIEKLMSEGYTFERADEWTAGYFNFMYALCGNDEDAALTAVNNEWKDA